MAESDAASEAPTNGQEKRRFSFLAILGLVLFGLAGLYISWRPVGQSNSQVMVAARDLPPYSRITATDIATRTLPVVDSSSAVTVPANALGRFTTAPMEMGAVFTDNTLLDAPQVGDDWWIITAPISATIAPAPGETMLLVGVNESGESVRISTDAVALGVEEAGAVIALPPADGMTAAGYLSEKQRLLLVRVVP